MLVYDCETTGLNWRKDKIIGIAFYDGKICEFLSFKDFSDDGYYLAGGTGLALHLGHRDSIDFDFF